MHINAKANRVDASELQTNILAAFQREKHELTIWLMNQANPIVGRLKRFDMYTITVSGSDGKYHLLYKHGIAGFSVDADAFKKMTFKEDSIPAMSA